MIIKKKNSSFNYRLYLRGTTKSSASEMAMKREFTTTTFKWVI